MKRLISLFTLCLAVTVYAQTEPVDLGLSVQWGTCNIGATCPQEVGNRYAWGETETKDMCSWADYRYCTDGRGKKFSKYVMKKRSGNKDGLATLELSDDAAHATLGSKWRMPTEEEVNELRSLCRWVLEDVDGVSGYRVYSENTGNSIFIPFTEEKFGDQDDDGGVYWTSDLEAKGDVFRGSSKDAESYVLSRKFGVVSGSGSRFLTLPIRPVWDENL